MAKKKKRTNLNVKVDSELWERLVGLSKFLGVHRFELLEQSIADMIEKHQKGRGNHEK
jgi:predicted transcriptional regulator